MILNFCYLIIGVLVLVSTCVMTIWYKSNRILNFYLVITSVILCLYLIIVGLKKMGVLNFSIINYYQVILVLTPCVYLYFKNLITNKKNFSKEDFVYFIIPLLLFSFFQDRDFGINLIKYSLLVLFLFFYSVFYSYKTYVLLINVSLLNNLSERIVLIWGKFIFKLMIAVFIHFFVWSFAFLFKIDLLFNVLDTIFLIIFLMGYFKVIFTPEILYGISHIKSVSNLVVMHKSTLVSLWNSEIGSKISSDKDLLLLNRIQSNVYGMIKDIDRISIDNHIFRNCEFSINDLASSLNLPKYYLEFIFKYYCKVSFSEYRNIIRIYDSIQLIDEGFLNTNKLETLAKCVGFSSYNPFLVNFKQYVGVSPNIFSKDKKTSKSNYFNF